MKIDNEYCEKHCKGYRDTSGRCFVDGFCDAYYEHQKNKMNVSGDSYCPDKCNRERTNKKDKMTLYEWFKSICTI